MRECSVGTERQKDAVAAAVRVLAEHGDFVRAVIRLRVCGTARREDMFQGLFLRLLSRPVPPGARSVRGYLYQMIVHDSVDLTRVQANERRHLKNYAKENRISIYNTPSPIAIKEEREEQDTSFRVLTGSLRPREAEVVTLRFRDNYSIGEIAAEMGIHRRSVSRYLTSGLRELRRTWAIE